MSNDISVKNEQHKVHLQHSVALICVMIGFWNPLDLLHPLLYTLFQPQNKQNPVSNDQARKSAVVRFTFLIRPFESSLTITIVVLSVTMIRVTRIVNNIFT